MSGTSLFQKARKEKSKLRLAIAGPSGSGKTYTALALATGLGKRVAVIDTERGSASLYADKFNFDEVTLADSHAVTEYIACIEEADAEGYDVLVIDSLSHAWMGKDGALERVEANKARNNGNSFTAWRDVTPNHNRLVDAILGCNMHVIATLRAKTEYVQEKDANGKTVIRKVGLAPIQRDGMEYEFTLFGDMNHDHQLIVTKSRCDEFADAIITKPGKPMADKLLAWLNNGVKAAPRAKPVDAPVAEEEPEVQATANTPDELTAEYQELALRIEAAESKDELALLKPLVREHKAVSVTECKDLQQRYKAQDAALTRQAAGN